MNPSRLNNLMKRCVFARRQCEAYSAWTPEEFKIIYFPDEPRPWYVGFYEPDQGKQTADGRTLEEALTLWLQEHEHSWDGPLLPEDLAPMTPEQVAEVRAQRGKS